MLVPHTTPYAWPFDAALDPTRCALVVCGSGPAWSARCPLDESAEANIEALRTVATAAGVLVVLVRHQVAGLGSIVLDGVATPPSLESRAGEVIVDAVGIDGFYGSSLDAVLRSYGRVQLLLAGRGFETTVHSTLRRANDRGYECLTIADACVASEPSLRAASISTIEMSGGIFGAVGLTDAAITTLTLTQPEALP